MALVIAYSVSAGLAWTLLGLLLNALPLSHISLVLIIIYCVFYGVLETAGAARPAPPGSSWQVSQSLVAGVSRRRRILVWGVILGPGFATRNPYAGFGLLLLVVAAFGSIRTGALVAAAIGLAHGTGRALALLRDARHIGGAEYLNAVMRAMRWRTFDGLVLLGTGSLAAIYYLHGA